MAANSLQYLSPSAYRNWKAAVAGARANAVDALVLMLGDSTMAGYNGTVAGAKAIAPPAQTAKLLTAYGLSSSDSTSNYNYYSGGVSFNWDPKNTANTNWGAVPGGQVNALGFPVQSTTNAATLSYAPGRSFDSVDVYFYDTTGSVTVAFNGTSTLATITGAGSGYVPRKVTVSGTLGTAYTSWTITQSGTTGLPIMAVVPHFSTTSAINVVNGGQPGYSLTDYASAANSFDPRNSAFWSVFRPNLLFIESTINDANKINGSTYTQALYQSNLQAIIACAQAVNCDVVLSTGHPINGSANPTWAANIASILSVLYSVSAGSNSLIALFDTLQYHYVSYGATNPTLPYYDGIHLSTAGYLDKSELNARAIMGLLRGSVA
jgi:lysophospholipase L1-like esterase